MAEQHEPVSAEPPGAGMRDPAAAGADTGSDPGNGGAAAVSAIRTAAADAAGGAVPGTAAAAGGGIHPSGKWGTAAMARQSGARPTAKDGGA